jgi:hypothetical protein
MAAERLSMRKLREVLRLHALGHSMRAIGRSLQVSHNTAALYLRRAAEAGLTWPASEDLGDAAEKLLVAESPRLDRLGCAHVRLLRRCARSHGAGQSQDRCAPRLLLRSRRKPHLS